MIHELTEKIMANIGLDIDNDFKIVDQDYGNTIMMDKKYLKCSYNIQEPIIGKDDILFNPIMNIKVMEFIFAYFLEKYQLLNQTYIMSYCQMNNTSKETALYVRGTHNTVSYFYKSDTLKYIDIIFRLSGYKNIEFLKKYDGRVR